MIRMRTGVVYKGYVVAGSMRGHRTEGLMNRKPSFLGGDGEPPHSESDCVFFALFPLFSCSLAILFCLTIAYPAGFLIRGANSSDVGAAFAPHSPSGWQTPNDTMYALFVQFGGSAFFLVILWCLSCPNNSTSLNGSGFFLFHSINLFSILS